MAKVSTNITIDAETKTKAQALLADFGMDLSTAVNVFLKQMIYEGSFPFMIKRGEEPNEETKRTIENARRGIGLSRGFSSVHELMEDLNADGEELEMTEEEKIDFVTARILREHRAAFEVLAK